MGLAEIDDPIIVQTARRRLLLGDEGWNWSQVWPGREKVPLRFHRRSGRLDYAKEVSGDPSGRAKCNSFHISPCESRGAASESEGQPLSSLTSVGQTSQGSQVTVDSDRWATGSVR